MSTQIPSSTSVARNMEVAASDPTAIAVELGISPKRLTRAGQGLLSKGSRAVAAYFRTYAANPYEYPHQTRAIFIASVPLFSLPQKSLLGQAVESKHVLNALVAPLRAALSEQGFEATFNFIYEKNLHVTLTVRQGGP